MMSTRGLTRAHPRTTALGALAILLPLFAALLWWGFHHRYAPGDPEILNNGSLSVVSLLVASCLVAGGPALLMALVLANHGRLRTVFRPTWGKAFTAVFLGGCVETPFVV